MVFRQGRNTNRPDWQGESPGFAWQSKILNNRIHVELLSNLQGFQRELSRIYRPKLYRYWSQNNLILNLTVLCPEKFFRPFFVTVRKNFYKHPPPPRAK